jgi:hypothetical protein
MSPANADGPNPRRRSAALLLLVIAAGGAVWLVRPRPAPPPLAPRIVRDARPVGAAAVALGRLPPHANPNPPGPAEPSADAPSRLADRLNSPETDIRSDLRIVDDIFAAYRSATHGENPIGENVDITEVLTGRNKLGFAFIPKDCPAIDAEGELCDRWGTPFFFHQISGDEMEIRSAGPDRKMWTADDVVLTPDVP